MRVKIVLLATVATLALTGYARAGEEYIMTATGVITSGSQVTDYFGGGSSLVGDAVTYSIIVSADGLPNDSNFVTNSNGDTTASYLSQVSPGFAVAINGASVTFDNGGTDNGSSSALNLTRGHVQPAPFGDADSMYAGGYFNGAGDSFAEGDIEAYAFWSAFIQSVDLNVPETDIVQSLDAAIPSVNSAFFEYYDPGNIDGMQLQFTASLSTITLAPYIALNAVPEPATFGIFGLGILGLIASRKKQTHLRSFS